MILMIRLDGVAVALPAAVAAAAALAAAAEALAALCKTAQNGKMHIVQMQI